MSRASLVLSALATIPLGGCLFDPDSSPPPRTRFDFSALDSLANPLSRWYDVPAGKSLTSVKFAFRTLDYARDADSNIDAFAAEAGGLPALAGAYVDFRVNPVRLRAFLDAVHAKGSVPYLTFDPKEFANPDVVAQRAYLGQIPQGLWDAKLREVAGVLRDFGRPVVFRFAHEMNGNWYPYAGAFSGGPATYVAAWRYVHALFAAEGASRLVWVFSPNATSHPDAAWNAPFAYYPGSAYVDWIAVDVYEHPDQKRQGLASLLDPFYNEMGLFWEGHAGPDGKRDSAYALRPFGLAEFGTARTGAADKGDWYAEALTTIAADARIGFHALYNARNGDKDFSIGGLGPRLAPGFAQERLLFGPLALPEPGGIPAVIPAKAGKAGIAGL
jgi:hypothetical protein